MAGSIINGNMVFGTGGAALSGFSASSAQPATPGGSATSGGGLTFVNVASTDTASGTGNAAPQSNDGGRDASGFKRVFVVAGGIKLPADLGNPNNDDSSLKAE